MRYVSPALRTATMVASTVATAVVFLSSTVASQRHSGCISSTYYSSLESLNDRDTMHSLVRITHQGVLPYTSGSLDVWDALVSLDTPDGGLDVELIYGDKEVRASPRDDGSCLYWNREHLWPKSRGVSTSGPDYTDLHHLRPADCNVNSARSNRYFAQCGVALPSSECTVPAHVEAAADTSRDSDTFLPPAAHRGDIARAIFYMDLRYDGNGESGVEDLVVSDCPESVPNGAGMGYLSQLLQWHIDDPPDAAEELRNYNVCKDYQGNRNPFVDHPDLVSAYFGAPRPLPTNGQGYDCWIPSPTRSPTRSPIRSPTPPPMSMSSCKGMSHGDVAIMGMRSDNPDSIVLVALADVPSGAEIYITDNAWTGTELKTNEGTKKLVVPSGGIAAGEIFGFENDSQSQLQHANDWSGEGGTLALSLSGDNVLIYCIDATTKPYFLFGAISQSAWLPDNADPGAFTSKESARPAELPSNCSVSLVENIDNWWYSGLRSGTKSGLLDAISNPDNWLRSNTEYSVSITSGFSVAKPPTPPPTSPPTPPPTRSPTRSPTPPPVPMSFCKGMSHGDVAVMGMRSDNPDSIVLIALADVPSGAEIYITDNAWTGTELKTNEGTKKLVVPLGGIAAGEIFGFEDDSQSQLQHANDWSGEGGNLALSTSGDSVLVYCIDATTKPYFLFGAISQSAWLPDDADPGAFMSKESARPAELPSNCSVTLVENIDNWWYSGLTSGTKSGLLDAISNPDNWLRSNTDYNVVITHDFDVEN